MTRIIQDHKWYILDKDKNVKKASFEEYSKFMMVGNDRQIELTNVGDTTISTVFLGLGHGSSGNLWFETMTFGISEEDDEICERYGLWTNAVIGHVWITCQEILKMFENRMSEPYFDIEKEAVKILSTIENMHIDKSLELFNKALDEYLGATS